MNDTVAALRAATAELTKPGGMFEIEERHVGAQSLRFYKHAANSMRELIDAGRSFGEQEFTYYLGERLSFADFFARVDALAWQLVHHYQLQKGDRVAIAMRNRPEWLESYAAIVSLGLIVVPLNSWGSAEELNYGLRDSGASLVICDPQREALIQSASTGLACQSLVVDIHSPEQPNRRQSTYELLLAEAAGKPMPEMDTFHPEDDVQIMYTSGTTGAPKGAVSSHRNICQAICNFEFHAICSAVANPDAVGRMMANSFAMCTLLSVPLFHVSGCYAAFLLNLRAGRKLVIAYKWDAADALRLIEAEKVTVFSAVPTMVIELLQHPDFTVRDTRSLFSLGGGGGACTPAFKHAIDEQFASAYVGTGYGMTESNASCSSCTGAAFTLKPDSTGTLSPIVDLKTCDDEGRMLERGDIGEICLRSPCNIGRYWNQPDASAKLLQDGWMATGDIGYLDNDDFVFIVGRKKDMIIRGGENIYPAEIELLLSNLPGLTDSAVVGMPHDTLGEVPVLIVQRRDASLTESEIATFLASKLAAFKQPVQIHFRETLPRNPAGKVLKPALREELLINGS